MKHYNSVRPHRAKDIGNNVLDVNYKPQSKGEIRCEQKLDGLITEWLRQKAVMLHQYGFNTHSKFSEGL